MHKLKAALAYIDRTVLACPGVDGSEPQRLQIANVLIRKPLNGTHLTCLRNDCWYSRNKSASSPHRMVASSFYFDSKSVGYN